MDIAEWNRQQTIIGQLKARYTGAPEELERTTLRLRVERMLANADLRPPGLSSGAMLIVRRLHNPASMPVSVLSHSAPPGWQASLRDQLAALYAAAARPASGTVLSDAPSVLFADPAEMLTCLTRDLLSGRAWECWYWQQALRGLSPTPGSALPQLWSAHAAFLPEVFASLDRAETFHALTHCSPHAIEQVIRSLHESFDLPAEALAVVSGQSSDTLIARQGRENLSLSHAEEPLPPWKQWLSTPPTLSPEARYLLGLGLTLHHAPAFARSTRFTASAARWLQHERTRRRATTERRHEFAEPAEATHNGQHKSLSAAQEQAGEKHASQERIQRTETAARKQALEQQATLTSRAESAEVISSAGRDSANGSFPPEDVQFSSSTPGKPSGQPEVFTQETAYYATQSPPQQVHATPPSPATPSLPAAAPLQQPSPDAPYLEEAQAFASDSGSRLPDTPSVPKAREFIFGVSKGLPADGIFTRLGGILYLINVVVGLNLLREMEELFAEYAGGWAIIEVLARGLLALGNLHEDYVHDPIWSALALLDGREAGMPVAASGLPDGAEHSFRLPVAWLRRYGSTLWSVVQHDERLLLYDGVAGFLIADVHLRGRSFFEAALAEVEAYHQQGLEVQWTPGSPSALRRFPPAGLLSVGDGEANPLAAGNVLLAYLDKDILWWAGRVLGFVYSLLARALEVPPDEPGQLATLVLCKHGQLIASRTHVDLYMSMEEIDLAVRRAGLDRDPGWVPDLARIVYFHFD